MKDTTPLNPDDVRKMLIEACEELLAERNGVTNGNVITRRIGHKKEYIDVKHVRGLYGYTQDQFANALDVTPAAVKSWEQGIRKPRGPSKIVLEAMEIVAMKKHDLKEKQKKKKTEII